MSKTIQKVTEQLKEISQQKEVYEKKRKEMLQEFKNNMEILFKDLFEAVPSLKAVNWRQYTPYFNDGETCYYSSCHKDPEIEGEDCGRRTERYTNIKSDIREFMSLFDDDLMMDLFGDHVKIIVTKEGITVEDYEHE